VRVSRPRRRERGAVAALAASFSRETSCRSGLVASATNRPCVGRSIQRGAELFAMRRSLRRAPVKRVCRATPDLAGQISVLGTLTGFWSKQRQRAFIGHACQA
jgi:hypothetical protein